MCWVRCFSCFVSFLFLWFNDLTITGTTEALRKSIQRARPVDAADIVARDNHSFVGKNADTRGLPSDFISPKRSIQMGRRSFYTTLMLSLLFPLSELSSSPLRRSFRFFKPVRRSTQTPRSLSSPASAPNSSSSMER